MSKSKRKKLQKKTEAQEFVEDLDAAFSVPLVKKYMKWVVTEAPLDAELLSISSVYRLSRQHYLSLGGIFVPSVCSAMRSLSSQDLFVNRIEYRPFLSELFWFKNHSEEVADPTALLSGFSCYNGISLFHEQNHRILWPLLPPAPTEEKDFCRYLNFAESLVVTLDLVLGDEIGKELSPAFERVKVIYRPGGQHRWSQRSRSEYRSYLLSVLYVTYLVLELIERDDILNAAHYVLPGQKRINEDAYERGTELSELFTLNTNRQWQQRFWSQAQKRLAVVQKDSVEDPLYLPEDPLDFEEEFVIANRIFDHFGL